MSVVREDNVCKVTFEDDAWKEAAPDVFSVSDGTVPFYSAGTWLFDGKQTLRSGAIGNSATSETTITVTFQMDGTINLNCAVSIRLYCAIQKMALHRAETMREPSDTCSSQVLRFRMKSGI